MTDENFSWLKSTVFCATCALGGSGTRYKHVTSEDADTVTLECGHIVNKEEDYARRNISDRSIAWAQSPPGPNDSPDAPALRARILGTAK